MNLKMCGNLYVSANVYICMYVRIYSFTNECVLHECMYALRMYVYIYICFYVFVTNVSIYILCFHIYLYV